jgi:hypothetical protein
VASTRRDTASNPADASPGHLRATGAPAAADRSVLAQGGDPYLPPARRVAAPTASPGGAPLKALIERKIAERGADPYR